ncbi:MAG: hypothetical protein LBD60_04130 [Puniceicoccales bacterium]|jgi:hypothetical protein|nr:hypothetical protein [Puniceicoccales bacterium]
MAWSNPTDLGFQAGGESLPDLGTPTGKLSIFNMYIVLASYMTAYEKGLADTIKCIEGSAASDIDQGTLLRLQAMVQTWGTVASTSTGIIRTVGDTLTKIVQNVR